MFSNAKEILTSLLQKFPFCNKYFLNKSVWISYNIHLYNGIRHKLKSALSKRKFPERAASPHLENAHLADLTNMKMLSWITSCWSSGRNRAAADKSQHLPTRSSHCVYFYKQKDFVPFDGSPSSRNPFTM